MGVRREGWALHNLFSLNLIKGGKKRERNECGNVVHGRRTAAPSFYSFSSSVGLDRAEQHHHP